VTPTRTSVVGSMVEGQVIEFRAREGDFFAGGTLAQLRLTKLQISVGRGGSLLGAAQSQWQTCVVSLPIRSQQAQARERAADALRNMPAASMSGARNLGSNTPGHTAELDELKSDSHVGSERLW